MTKLSSSFTHSLCGNSKITLRKVDLCTEIYSYNFLTKISWMKSTFCTKETTKYRHGQANLKSFITVRLKIYLLTSVVDLTKYFLVRISFPFFHMRKFILTIFSNSLEGKKSLSCPHHLGENGNSRPGGLSPGREWSIPHQLDGEE